MVALAVTNDMIQCSFHEAREPILCVTRSILDHFHRTSSQPCSIKSKRFSTYCLSLSTYCLSLSTYCLCLSTYCLSLCAINDVPTWLTSALNLKKDEIMDEEEPSMKNVCSSGIKDIDHASSNAEKLQEGTNGQD